jgi:tRNA(Arg) A34 adenosine deaminase TadA
MPRILDSVIDETKKSTMALRVGAILYDNRGGKFIGHNTISNGVSLHAEMNVLQKCLKAYRLLTPIKTFMELFDARKSLTKKKLIALKTSKSWPKKWCLKGATH